MKVAAALGLLYGSLPAVLCAGNGLYNGTDGVTVLGPDNHLNVYASGKTWLVEFYAAWCGHCQHFAPEYKAFAASVTGWKENGIVAAVHCVEHANICKEHNIEGYPTVKVFGPNAKGPADGKVCRARTSSGLTGCLAESILTSQLGNVTLPTIHETHAKFHAAPAGEGPTYMVAVFEEKDSTQPLAKTLTLDLTGSKRLLIVTGTSDGSEAYGISTFPSAAIFTKGSPREYHRYLGTSREALLPVLRGLEEGKSFEDLTVKPANKADLPKLVQDGVLVPMPMKGAFEGVHLTDLVIVIYRILRREVPSLHAEIKGASFQVLSRFIGALAHNFPIDPARQSLLELHKLISARQEKGDSLTDKEWHSMIDGWALQGVNLRSRAIGVTEEPWITCKGSAPQLRGYTCGLWLLMHTLAANCAEDDTVWCGGSLMIILRDFIQEFFSCEECRKHFAAALEKDAKDIDKWTKEQTVMWLWKAHNIVNNRLVSAPSTAPAVPKVQFPPAAACAPCRDVSPETPAYYGVAWNTTHVYEYLLLHYSSHIVIDATPFTWRPGLIAGALLVLVVALGRPWLQRNRRFVIMQLRKVGLSTSP
eukprot:comp14826_c0_seq1/m.11294 comp14826_c0_seq1/g.11294  ORF comp14826_c0_seq1/g.11294 comp14826_c0_seq1/m.11294 type:complete len:590 (-) comp14826_c0_seq1:504-2273(-)